MSIHSKALLGVILAASMGCAGHGRGRELGGEIDRHVDGIETDAREARVGVENDLKEAASKVKDEVKHAGRATERFAKTVVRKTGRALESAGRKIRQSVD